MRPPDNLKMIAPGVWVDPILLAAAAPAAAAPPPGDDDAMVLAEHHPMWDHASGGDRNEQGRQWTIADLTEANLTLAGISGKKSGVFFDLLLAQPGRLFSVEDIMAAAPTVFASAYSIAGSFNGFRKHTDRAERVYPFHWWEGDTHGTPTLYAIRPSVAAVFNAARHR